MTDLTQLNLADARDGLAKKQFSAVELTQAHIDRVSASSALNAYVLETPEKALAMAAESDAKIAAGEARPLEGLPIGVKDLFCALRVCGQRLAPISSAISPRLMKAR